jgi:hypothetical protein
VYGEAVRAALIVIWEASDRICGKRRRPLVPIVVGAMERHGHLQLAPEVQTGVMAMSVGGGQNPRIDGAGLLPVFYD